MFLLRTRDLEPLPDKSSTKSSQTAEDTQSLSRDSKMIKRGYTAANSFQGSTRTKLSMVTIADLPRTGNADQTIWSEISKFQAILVISRVW